MILVLFLVLPITRKASLLQGFLWWSFCEM